MKILFLTSSISRLGGGLFDAVRKQAITLNKYPNTTVNIMSLRDRFSKVDLQAWLPIVPQAFQCNGLREFGYGSAMKYQLEKEAPAIIHSHGLWMYQSLLCSRYCSRHTVPYVISPHGMLDPWALSNSYWKKKIAKFLYENRNLRGASCLHALNQAEAKSMRIYGLKNPICQIPNGVDIPLCKESARPPWERVVENGKKILLFLGRIHPKKGLVPLISGWKLLLRSHPALGSKWSLVVVGWGQNSHEMELKKMCKSLGIENDIHFLGPLFAEQKTAAYQNADAFILPSFSEGLPMTILEAWSHKLAVLMTPACNLPAGFEQQGAIEIQPNAEDISRGLHNLFSLDDEERLLVGEKGFAIVQSSFTWDIVAEGLFSVYSWILGGGSPPLSVLTD